jgi:uncharacterized protein (DUF488 family)
MQTEDFEEALKELMKLARKKRVAIMCSEAVPWRCHRSLVADALIAKGWKVIDIFTEKNAKVHKLTPFAKVTHNHVIYPSASG